MKKFPQDFRWGVATASYQIEGAHNLDGKGASVWDHFCSNPGNIRNNETGAIATDHYHNLKKDVSLLKELNVNSYRFSLSWPRIIPDGKGKINSKGLDFYERLVDELLRNNIEPYATLFHWDYPQALQELSGWCHPESSHWFEEYTQVVSEKIGDRVKSWMTFNEPNIFVPYGHGNGYHAPGVTLNKDDMARIHKNVLLAHGKSVGILRENVKDSNIGIAMAVRPTVPMRDQDLESARDLFFSCDSQWGESLEMDNMNRYPWYRCSWWTEPLFNKAYPKGTSELIASLEEKISDEEMEIISKPLDFLGVNTYVADLVEKTAYGVKEVPFGDGHPKTFMDWPIIPESLYYGPKFLYERYHCPIMITENGMSSHDWKHLDGKIHDPSRIDFTTRYLSNLQKAYSEGVDIKGYFHWSFLDNFEWSEGYDRRFGLVYVDYETKERTLKESAYWYRKIIDNRGLN